ncbi:MAG: aspartate racemase, partial [Pseudomonadota bacterium]
MRPVGVIGGMGPAATVLFMSRVIDAVEAKDDADHIPLLVDQNPQVPSRIGTLLEDGDEDPGPVL